MKGTWAGKRTKVSRSRDGEEFSLKIKKGSSKHRGVREKREMSSIWLKINFLMNWKISFKNSYFIIIFAKQVQRGLWTIKKSPSFHWAHPRLRTFSTLEWNWSELNPNLWQRGGMCTYVNRHRSRVVNPEPPTHCSSDRGFPFPLPVEELSSNQEENEKGVGVGVRWFSFFLV